MNKLLKFGEYTHLREMADFGFEKMSNTEPTGGTKILDDAGPINPINCETIMAELARLPALGIYKPSWTWQDILEWGDGVGAIKIDVSPLGSYKIVARRHIKDIRGETTWVCKKVFPLDENEHDDNEIELAHNIYEGITKISTTMIDSPRWGNYPDFERLVEKLTHEVRHQYPNYIMFPKGTKKISEDYYKIYFEFKGHGVEAPGSNRAEQFDIDIFWDRKKGLVRIWGYDIVSSKSQHSWQPQPSEFDEWFSPAQPIEEIIECVVAMFLTY